MAKGLNDLSHLKSSLRQRIMTFVGAMVMVSLLGSIISLYRMTEVNQILESINHVSVPLGRLFSQMQSDAEVLHREVEQGLGVSHWKDPHWKPRPVPNWVQEVLENEMSRVTELIKNNSNWTSPESRAHWSEWAKQISVELQQLMDSSSKLYRALEEKNESEAEELYPKWTLAIEEWKRKLHWGTAEYERSLRQNFAATESRVAELRTGLEMILGIVVLMSLLLLWLGERALRPLVELTLLAREITRRGLRREDKTMLPVFPMSRSDEVAQLAREFHHMATALLEREITVESQKSRLQEQNRLLREMGELNETILHSIESILIVTDLEGKVTQCNPGAARWLESAQEQIIGSKIADWSKLRSVLQDEKNFSELEPLKLGKLGPLLIDGRHYGGHVMPLRQDQRDDQKAQEDPHGAILVLHDLTEEMDLQERLRRAENLAAVGRMSAQVAHEVRNPLHSIGLEAEMAIEMAARSGEPALKYSLQSILGSVDRLQKITENYLKLSRLSEGKKYVVDLSIVLESVLATYSPVCEAQHVRVDWAHEASSHLKVWGDPDLLEQVLGNLLRNSLQALEGEGIESGHIFWKLGNSESGKVWLRIEDNGPGIHPEIKDRLFTPFVTTRAQGTGLGLSFIKKVLEDHGGTIQSIEQGAKKGACFELTLPQVELQEEKMEFREAVL